MRGKKEHNGEITNRGKDCKRDGKKQIENGSGTKVSTEEQKTYYSHQKECNAQIVLWKYKGY